MDSENRPSTTSDRAECLSIGLTAALGRRLAGDCGCCQSRGRLNPMYSPFEAESGGLIRWNPRITSKYRGTAFDHAEKPLRGSDLRIQASHGSQRLLSVERAIQSNVKSMPDGSPGRMMCVDILPKSFISRKLQVWQILVGKCSQAAKRRCFDTCKERVDFAFPSTAPHALFFLKFWIFFRMCNARNALSIRWTVLNKLEINRVQSNRCAVERWNRV